MVTATVLEVVGGSGKLWYDIWKSEWSEVASDKKRSEKNFLSKAHTKSKKQNELGVSCVAGVR